MKTPNFLLQKITILLSLLLLPFFMTAQPNNDNCVYATPLTLGNGCVTISGTTVDATDSGIPHDCGSYIDYDVWFSFIAPASGLTRIQTSNLQMDDVAVVYDACNGVEVGCDSGDSDTNINLSGLTPFAPYYIAIYPYANSSPGTFDICVFEPVPDNDDCATAIPILVGTSSCTSPVIGNNIGATDSGVAHNCFGGYVGGDMWYSFVCPASGVIQIYTYDVEPGFFNIDFQIYDDCTNLVPFGCDTGNSGTVYSLTPNSTYYVAVWEYNNDQIGNFTICAVEPTCSDVVATLSVDNSNCANDLYNVVVDLTSLGLLNSVNINTDGSSSSSYTNVGTGIYTLSGFGPTDGYIVVTISDANDATCITDFYFSIPTGCPPVNDECSSPINLITNPDLACTNAVPGTISNATASPQAISSICPEDVGNPNRWDDDVWFSFIATAPFHEIQLQNFQNGSSDMIFQLASGSCGALVDLFCQDFPDSGFLTPILVVGNTYLLRIASNTGLPRNTTFDICIGTPPCVDISAVITINTSDCANDLYNIDIDLSSLGLATSVNISHDGTSSDNYTGVGTGLYTLSDFGSTEGNITVTFTDSNDPACMSQFLIPIPFACPPLNDNCSQATPLTLSNTACVNPLSGTNINATNSGIAHSCGNYNGGDVWFSFVAPASGVVNLQTWDESSNNSFYTILEVYDDCNGSNSVVCGFQYIDLTDLTPNQTYYVAVWDYNNDGFDEFNICAWDPSTCYTPPAATITIINEDCVAGTYDLEVEVTDLGPSTGVNITHDGSSSDSYNNVIAGTYNLTGFMSSDFIVKVTIGNHADPLCFSEITPGLINCPPVNDDCSNAINLTINSDLACNNSVQATLSNATASTEALPVSCPISGEDRWDDDIWFSFTATAPFHVIQTQNIQNGYGDLLYQLVDGTCASYVDLICHDDPEYFWTTPMLVVGNTYLLRIATFPTTPQTTIFDLCIGIAPPTNDDCDNAIGLTVSPSACGNTVAGTNYGATDSGVAHACGSYLGGDVWFSFVAPASGEITVETSNDGSGNFDTLIEVYDECTNLVSEGCDDDGSDQGNFSKLYLTGLTPNETYYVAVWNYNGNALGSFNICAWDPGTCNEVTADLTIDATNCLNDLYNVIIDLTDLGLAQSVNISHDGSSPSYVTGVLIGVYTFSGFLPSDGAVTFTITDSGDPLCITEVTIYIPSSCPPMNDNCGAAINLTTNPDLSCNNPVTGTLSGATASTETLSSSCPGFAGDPNRWKDDVWFSFTATAAFHEIQTQNFQNGSDLIYQLAEGTCASLVVLACHDDPNTGFKTPMLIIGNTYLLRIASYSSLPQTIIFDICIGTPPCGDTAATLSIDTNNCGNDLYNIVVDLTALGLATAVNISHNGSSPTGFTGEGTGSYTLNDFEPTDGLVIVSITDSNDPQCVTQFMVNIPEGCPPANDECNNAIDMNVNPDSSYSDYVYYGTTNLATASSESTTSCSSDGWDDDVWYRFTATTDITFIQIQNNGSTDLDFMLSLYSGEDCQNLTQVACVALNTSLNVFTNTVPTQTYYFRIATSQLSSIGSFNFNIAVSENCYPELTINGDNNGGIVENDREAIGFINSTETIKAGATVDYDSGLEVLLDIGFEVELGATFEAFIDGCNNGMGGSNLMGEEEEK